MTDRQRRLRFLGVVACIGAAMLALLARLLYLQLWTEPSARTAILQDRIYREVLPADRGQILDGGEPGAILAIDRPCVDVCVDPKIVLETNAVDAVSRGLKGVLGAAAVPDLDARLARPHSRFECVARQMPTNVAPQLARLALPGVFVQPVPQRAYPLGATLCHVVGFVNAEGVGSAGIEQALERQLKGVPGEIVSWRDGRRREIADRRISETPPRPGATVTLTLDQQLQLMVERALDGVMERHHAQAAWCIVERVRTGEILALANRPNYDPRDYRHSEPAQRLNRAIGVVYEPGSTFKVATISAALDAGVVSPETTIDCEGGRWWFMDKILRDSHPYGVLSVADILKKSSNIGAAKTTLRLTQQFGNARLDEALRRLQFGKRLGFDLPGEEAGILHPAAHWSGITPSRIAMGQGVAVTSLQMVGLLCCIANEGRYMKPYLIRRVVQSDGTVLQEGKPQVLAQAVRPETAAIMRQMLARVTEPGGTGVKACIPNFRVAGKTGTAQKVVAGHYSETDYMASFVGFLPVDAPEIGLIVVVDNPQPLHTGGTVAAPVFAEIAEQAVRYLEVPLPPLVAAAGQR